MVKDTAKIEKLAKEWKIKKARYEKEREERKKESDTKIKKHFESTFELLKATLTAIDVAIETVKKYDGKVLTRRLSNAMRDSGKNNPVCVYYDKDTWNEWKLYALVNGRYPYSIDTDWIVWGGIPTDCLNADGRIIAENVIKVLENNKNRINDKISDYKKYQNIWHDEMEKYNNLCNELNKIEKGFPSSLSKFLKKETVYNFSRPYEI